MTDTQEIFPVLKRKHLLDAIREYSDYVADIRGKSFEEFVREDYLQDKSVENMIVDTEKDESIYTMVEDYLSNHTEINKGNDNDDVVEDLVYVINKYIENNC